ncbi:HEPN domain protein [Aquisphaera giovannonii]|uniref:HEPN domain protein n=2 Tax=Aquisphaera giovannonii TaxID=406548 RepID=A0A5B9WDX2_9BACT|nr:HEPN domain protein [Aquisphaera giovannonii]
MPGSREARLFYRCAYGRCDEAQVLLRAGYTTGAVYLAGYTVECILKALILNAVPPGRVTEVLQLFRGNHAHDFEWLKALYRRHQGATLPPDVRRAFTLVNEWSTDMRYSPEHMRGADAERFLSGVDAILKWAEERM